MIEQAATAGNASGAGRAVGAGGAGVLTKLGLTGGAKIAAGCLATGAVTAACVVTGLVPGGALDGDDGREAVESGAFERIDLPAIERDIVNSSGRVGTADASRNEKLEPDSTRDRGESVSPAVDPSTPPGEQEFGVASAAPAPSPPAAPGGAASTDDVQKEFGP